MKLLKLVAVSVFFTLFGNCTKNESTEEAPVTIEGQWKLINVSGGIAGINDSFSPNQIIWTINSSNHTVTVVNTNTNPDLNSVLETGIYPFSIENNSNSVCNQTITINGMNLGCVLLSVNELNINYQFADGYNLKFIR